MVTLVDCLEIRRNGRSSRWTRADALSYLQMEAAYGKALMTLLEEPVILGQSREEYLEIGSFPDSNACSDRMLSSIGQWKNVLLTPKLLSKLKGEAKWLALRIKKELPEAELFLYWNVNVSGGSAYSTIELRVRIS